MQFPSRHYLLSLSEPELLGLAECHGLEIEGKRPAIVLEELSDLVEDFRALTGEEEEA